MRIGNNGVLLAVAEAATIFGVPVGTLRRWAHEDRWDRHGGARSCHWKWEQVQDGYDRRRADHVVLGLTCGE